jgi:hypothetical protein
LRYTFVRYPLILLLVLLSATSIVNAVGDVSVSTSKTTYFAGEPVFIYFQAGYGTGVYGTAEIIISGPAGTYSAGTVSIETGIMYTYTLSGSAVSIAGYYTVKVVVGLAYDVWEGYASFSVVPGVPDLIVMDIRFDKSQPFQEGTMIQFGASVGNQGGSANNFMVEVYLDGTLYDSGTLSLGAGETMALSTETAWQAIEGAHTIEWVLDATNVISESNEGNNRMSRSFNVGPRLITMTATLTTTSTRTKTERYTATTSVTTYKGTIQPETITMTTTFTSQAVTIKTTLVGLYYATSYSPTVTVTVTKQQGTGEITSLTALAYLTILSGIVIIPLEWRTRKPRR